MSMRVRALVTPLLLLKMAFELTAENWPGFRGPTGQGVSTERGVPTEWSNTSNIAWKTAIPGEGWSSPIVFDDRVFVTTAIDNGVSCRLICLKRHTGEILWNREVVQQAPLRKEKRNSYATPTPVTDGQRVYVVFGDGSVAALSLKGEVLWTYRDFKFYSQHGLGVSPILFRDLLIVPFDWSSDGEDKKVGWQKPWDQSFILALDQDSGKVHWKARRGLSRIAHVTPNILRENGREELVSGAGDVIQGFDPKNGEKLWWVQSQGEGVVPSIVIGDGLIFTASGFEKPTIRAVRAGGKGEVTQTHIAWEQTRNVPSVPSFVYVKPYLFIVTDGGVAACLKAGTGEIVWQERIGGTHAASPIYADGKIYFLSMEGESVIIEAKPEFRLVARNSIGEYCQASYAVSQGQLFIRSDKNLYCIGQGRHRVGD
jgi:outer membrane protein assembly factor BamB